MQISIIKTNKGVQVMNTIIQELGRDVFEGFKTRNEAALVLNELAEIDVAIAWDMVEAARMRLVRRQAIIDTAEQNDMGVEYERQYRLGAMI